MNYTLNQLQIFLKVVQTNSVTKAAEELHLTQPAVSIQLRNFQDQFDIPLTEVVGRKLYITEFGKEIGVAAEQIINQVNAINYKTSAYRGQLSGRLKLSIVSTGKYVMPYFLSHFLRDHPGIELLMDVTNKTKVVEHLEDNDIDFALVSLLPSHLNVERLDLLQNKLYLVGNANASVPKNKNPNKILKDTPLIFREKGSGTRQIMEKYVANHSVHLFKKLELTSNEAVKQALLADMGYSIMPLIGIKRELHNKELQIIPAKGLPIITTWSLIWMKGKKMTPISEAFLEYLMENKDKIADEIFSWYENY